MQKIPKPTFSDLSDLFTHARPLSYLLVFCLLVGTLLLWAVMGLFAWNAFPLGAVGTLLLSLFTFSLQGGLWNEIKMLERSLPSLPLPAEIRTRKTAMQLSQLDSRYWLILEIMRLLAWHKQGRRSVPRIERLMQMLQQQRYRFQSETMALRRRYYPLVDRLIGDRDREARAYVLAAPALQPVTAAETETEAPRPQSASDEVGQATLPGTSDNASSPIPSVTPARTDRPASLTVRSPTGQFIADISGKGKKYHFQADCQIWKSLMYDFIMGESTTLLCDRSPEAFEQRGLKPCSACDRKHKH